MPSVPAPQDGSIHVSVVVPRRPGETYAAAADVAALPRWAAGLAAGALDVEHPGDATTGARVTVDSPMGRVRVGFAPRNDLGVLDHEVALPDGSVVLNPLRVVAHPAGSEVLFTVRRLAMTDDELARDVAAVRADLLRLRSLVLEAGVRPAQEADLPALAGIEAAADGLLRSALDLPPGTPWAPPSDGAARAAEPGFLLVAPSPDGGTAGFAHVLEEREHDGRPSAHLQQLAVHPGHGRLGHGTALLRAALAETARRGHDALTLTTFRDVAFNEPFYAGHGFTVVDRPEGVLARHVATEEPYARLAPRVALRRPVQN